MFEKAKSASSLFVCAVMSAYFCMGAYKCNVVVVLKMGAYIHRCLFSMGANNPNFTVLCNTYHLRTVFQT